METYIVDLFKTMKERCQTVGVVDLVTLITSDDQRERIKEILRELVENGANIDCYDRYRIWLSGIFMKINEIADVHLTKQMSQSRSDWALVPPTVASLIYAIDGSLHEMVNENFCETPVVINLGKRHHMTFLYSPFMYGNLIDRVDSNFYTNEIVFMGHGLEKIRKAVAEVERMDKFSQETEGLFDDLGCVNLKFSEEVATMEDDLSYMSLVYG